MSYLTSRSAAAMALAAALLGGLSGVAEAQTSRCFHVPDASAATGPCNTVPFGTGVPRNAKYQTLIPTTDLGAARLEICSIAFAPCGSGVRTFQSLQVRLGYFPGSGSKLSTTFAANIGASEVVLDLVDHAWHTSADTWQRIGLQQPFAYDPTKGHLVVELAMVAAARFGGAGSAGFRRAGTHQRVYAVGYTGAPPPTGLSSMGALKIELCSAAEDLALFGVGCAGSNRTVPRLELSGSAKLGGTFRSLLSQAPANTAVFLRLGLSTAPPWPLEIPFTNGCKLYASPAVSLRSTSDSTGRVDFPITIPNDATLVCGRFYLQWLVLDAAANSLGVTSSNYGRVLIGR